MVQRSGHHEAPARVHHERWRRSLVHHGGVTRHDEFRPPCAAPRRRRLPCGRDDIGEHGCIGARRAETRGDRVPALHRAVRRTDHDRRVGELDQGLQFALRQARRHRLGRGTEEPDRDVRHEPVDAVRERDRDEIPGSHPETLQVDRQVPAALEQPGTRDRLTLAADGHGIGAPGGEPAQLVDERDHGPPPPNMMPRRSAQERDDGVEDESENGARRDEVRGEVLVEPGRDPDHPRCHHRRH